MNSKHTPGPWVIERDPSNNTIAVIGPCAAEEYAGFAWLEVSEENAQMIATAPELLDFIAMIARMTTDTQMDGDMSGDDAVSTLSELIEGARTIIARATGDQS